ncbi:MAG TPA: carbon-nitrogen family hydrolase [Candidatus Competibacteraceae bacterium]|nr:carbon-nitrogen family hydrolase [Candidatus Competibacteraceae bacterium]
MLAQVIALQLDIVWENKAANHDKVRALLERARPEPSALVVLPEMFATGFSMKVTRIDEGEERPSERFLAALAQEFGVYVTGGLVNRAPDRRGLNQSLTFDPEGREVARYDKMHPFSFAKEDQHYAAGSTPLTFPWQGFSVCPVICYDLRFPELFRAGTRLGAEIFTVIANWPARREQHWLTLLQARAIENQAYVVGVNRAGNDPWLHYSGRSLIVDPKGEIIADAGAAEGAISALLDRAALSAWRAEFPALHDMRADLLPPL